MPPFLTSNRPSGDVPEDRFGSVTISRDPASAFPQQSQSNNKAGVETCLDVGDRRGLHAATCHVPLHAGLGGVLALQGGGLSARASRAGSVHVALGSIIAGPATRIGRCRMGHRGFPHAAASHPAGCGASSCRAWQDSGRGGHRARLVMAGVCLAGRGADVIQAQRNGDDRATHQNTWFRGFCVQVRIQFVRGCSVHGSCGKAWMTLQTR